jgi:short-subunit dehydrogenase
MKKVIITWVTKGIWRALCQKYIDEWYWVIGISSNEKNLEILKNEISSDKLELVKCDIWNEQDIENFWNFLKKKKDVISLINNVWIGFYCNFIWHTNEKIKEIININLLWTILLSKEVMWVLWNTLKNLTFVSSLAGKVWFNWLSIYSTTKYGIEWFADALRQELLEQWIDVLVVRPWIVNTNFFVVAKMEEYTRDLKNKMQSPKFVAEQIFESRNNRSMEVTIWKDKWFLFLKKFVPKSFERKLMEFFIS